jgi:transmembrane sensor
MSELADKIERTRSAIDVDWSEDRARVVGRAMVKRRRQRAVRRTVASTAALLLLVVGAGLGARHLLTSRSPVALAPSAPTAPSALAAEEGDVVTPMGSDTLMRRTAAPDGRVVIDIDHGGARVVSRAAGGLTLEVGEVRVEGSGAFTVERIGDRARVTVAHGRLTVAWSIGTSVLGDGDEAVFPPDTAGSPSAAGSAAPRPAPAPLASGAPWRSLAQSGEYDAAWTALSNSGPAAVREEPADLMLAADVARLSGHPEQAVTPLQKVLAAHSSDPRAPLAAFTLGRVELEQLGRPRDAAGAFEQARSLAPSGPLAEDALAREVEAWSRAGDATQAHDRAVQYVATFPDGRRLHAVKKFGGLE